MLRLAVLLIGYLVLKVAFVVINEHEGINIQVPIGVQRMSFGVIAALSQAMFF